jgi:hypothetical protein
MIYTAGVHHNLRVFDANGFEIFDVVNCDTATGQVTQIFRRQDGSASTTKDRKAIITLVSYKPAPLRVEKKNAEPKFSLGDRVRDRNGFEWVVSGWSRTDTGLSSPGYLFEYRLSKASASGGERDEWTVRDTMAFDAVAEKVGGAT